MMTVSYVGKSRGANILVVQPTNPGNPALCLSVSDPSSGRTGKARPADRLRKKRRLRHQGPARRSTARDRFAPDFGSITAQQTIGRSRYDALELNLRYNGPQGGVPLRLHLQQVDGHLVESGRTGKTRSTPSSRGRRRPSTCGTTSSRATTTISRWHACSTAGNALSTGWAISGITRFQQRFFP